jgi:hypothetical protein
MKHLGKSIIGVMLVLLIAGGALAYVKRDDLNRARERAALPEAVPYQSATQPSTTPRATPPRDTPTSSAGGQPSTATKPAAAVPVEVNLAVPFTAQAPRGIWEPPYKEFCEEASVLMAVSYLQGEAIEGVADAEQKMLAIKAFEEERLGHYEDTTAEETAVILREYYKIKDVTLLENPSAADLTAALAAGKLVILPAAGRLLGNPYYTPPGPLYHMLVIKGYTAEGKFITNDPGTRRGADFLYSPEVILNAMHDWRTDAQVDQGRKVVIIVG